ncbi:quinolinate synthase NadA [Caminibacter mediatlanticus TB-2]|uniref:Quinolinate synthase n=1 Tax=Caminibacter mediatlanticus TB-2 TaxID=391592 RepID=A0ABX5VB50_9BACT|nr:quinolinate synthase NadA [Caminibacter mediatlanticus]QCT94104.1 quinolinate synthase NadA [Caminibacter mediatlanticus TB-2]
MVEKIKSLLKKHNITIAAHYYQKDEVFYLANLTGDSLELAKKTANLDNPLIFCGVSFMGESAKILNPKIPVYMPKLASCSMARMAENELLQKNIEMLKNENIDFIPVAYINTTAKVKAIVGDLGGLTCTSSSAKNIIEKLPSNKKIFFLPDKNLGKNIANALRKSAKIIGEDGWQEADFILFDGHCSVHQLFMPEHIEFFKEKYPDIKIVVHPECSPQVCEMADFVGSTSQIINYVKEHKNERMAIGTEFNLVNRLKKEINPNIYILSSTKPECPSMNETTLKELYDLLVAIDEGKPYNEIKVDDEISKKAKKALDRMLELSK